MIKKIIPLTFIIILLLIPFAYAVELKSYAVYDYMDNIGNIHYKPVNYNYGYTPIEKNQTIRCFMKLIYTVKLPTYFTEYVIRTTIYSYVNPNQSINILMELQLTKGSSSSGSVALSYKKVEIDFVNNQFIETPLYQTPSLDLAQFKVGNASLYTTLVDNTQSNIVWNVYKFTILSWVTLNSSDISVYEKLYNRTTSSDPVYTVNFNAFIGSKTERYLFFVGVGWYYPIWYNNSLHYQPAYITVQYSDPVLIPKQIEFIADLSYYINNNEATLVEVNTLDSNLLFRYMILIFVTILTIYGISVRPKLWFLTTALSFIVLFMVFIMTGNPIYVVTAILYIFGVGLVKQNLIAVRGD